jgi:RNA polymerase sigma-70 factor (ECF subfamily)
VTDDDAARRARFEAIYTEHYGAIWAYVRRRTATAADVDDVVAQTWLTVWRRLDSVPADATLPWCYATARRVLANHRRGTDRRLRLVQRLTTDAGRVRGGVDDSLVSEGLADDLRAARLRAALDRLSEPDRELLRLVAWEALSHTDIAAVLGTSTANVSVRLHRARRRLEAALQDLTPPGHKVGTAPEGDR